MQLIGSAGWDRKKGIFTGCMFQIPCPETRIRPNRLGGYVSLFPSRFPWMGEGVPDPVTLSFICSGSRLVILYDIRSLCGPQPHRQLVHQLSWGTYTVPLPASQMMKVLPHYALVNRSPGQAI